jgi:hypothetical protein
MELLIGKITLQIEHHLLKGREHQMLYPAKRALYGAEYSAAKALRWVLVAIREAERWEAQRQEAERSIEQMDFFQDEPAPAFMAAKSAYAYRKALFPEHPL